MSIWYKVALVSTGRTNACPENDRTRCQEKRASPVGMLHPSKMFYGNLSKFGKRSSLVLRSRLGIVWSVVGCHCIWSGHRLSFNTRERGNFILFDKIFISTITLLKWRFQAFSDESLFEKLIWKSRRPQNKTSIRGASPGISYKL